MKDLGPGNPDPILHREEMLESFCLELPKQLITTFKFFKWKNNCTNVEIVMKLANNMV
jgi:hypothetical protein